MVNGKIKKLYASIFFVVACFTFSSTGGFTDGTSSGRPYTRIRLAADHANPSSCANSRIVLIQGSLPHLENAQTLYYDQQFSLILAASVNGNKLSAWTSSCVGGVNGDLYAVLTRVSFISE